MISHRASLARRVSIRGVVIIFALLFLVLPFVELYGILQVAHQIGGLPTFAVLIAVSVLGGWLVKREGIRALTNAQEELAAGRMPTKNLVDGLLIMFAGALLVTPGFLTDVVVVLLLLPPTRALLRKVVVRRFALRLASSTPAGSGFGASNGARGRSTRRYGSVIDVESTESTEADGTSSGTAGSGAASLREGSVESGDKPR